MHQHAYSLDLDLRTLSIHSVNERRMWRTVAAAGLLCVVLWFGAVLFLWLAQSWLLFNTGESRANTAPLDPSVFAQISFVTTGGLRLEGAVLSHGSADAPYWILYCPSAGASIRTARIEGHLQQLWSLGYNVFAFDYRGFGHNGGTPSEEGLYEDSGAAYRYVTHTLGVAAGHVILAGRSLGASVAAELATRVESGGLLLFSPIDSIPAVATRFYPWAPVDWLVRYRFDNRSRAAIIREPVVLVYGTPDHFMPLSEARSLFQEFHGRKKMLETNGNHHHSGFMDLNSLRDTLAEMWPPGPVRRTW
jgi:alpha/beta superfamily hydrolase